MERCTDELGRRRGSVDKGPTAAGRKRAREEGEQEEELTAEAIGWSAGSGKAWGRRDGGGDLGQPEVEDDGLEAMQGVQARFLPLGEAELNGGAGGHDRGVRRWLWPRQRRAAAMVASGGAAQRNQRRGMDTGRVRGSQSDRDGTKEVGHGVELAWGHRQTPWWRGALGRARVLVLLARGGGRLASRVGWAG